jgi:hypothetical protein
MAVASVANVGHKRSQKIAQSARRSATASCDRSARSALAFPGLELLAALSVNQNLRGRFHTTTRHHDGAFKALRYRRSHQRQAPTSKIKARAAAGRVRSVPPPSRAAAPRPIRQT